MFYWQENLGPFAHFHLHLLEKGISFKSFIPRISFISFFWFWQSGSRQYPANLWSIFNHVIDIAMISMEKYVDWCSLILFNWKTPPEQRSFRRCTSYITSFPLKKQPMNKTPGKFPRESPDPAGEKATVPFSRGTESDHWSKAKASTATVTSNIATNVASKRMAHSWQTTVTWEKNRRWLFWEPTKCFRSPTFFGNQRISTALVGV